MALDLLRTKTTDYKVNDAEELVIKPGTRLVRVVSDVMVFASVSADGGQSDQSGYPLVDFSPEVLSIPGGHYLHIHGSEDGQVWVTEIE